MQDRTLHLKQKFSVGCIYNKLLQSVLNSKNDFNTNQNPIHKNVIFCFFQLK